MIYNQFSYQNSKLGSLVLIYGIGTKSSLERIGQLSAKVKKEYYKVMWSLGKDKYNVLEAEETSWQWDGEKEQHVLTAESCN